MNEEEIYPVDPSKKIEPKMQPVTAAILGLIIVFFLYQIGGGLITVAIFGMDMQRVDPISLKLLTAAGQILFILLPALILSKAVYEDVTYIIRVRKPGTYVTIFFIIGLLPVTLIIQSYMFIQDFLLIKLAKWNPVINNIKEFLDKLDEPMSQLSLSFLSANSIIEYILVFIVVAMVPAICEEFFFRGYVQKSFEFKYSPFKSAIITSLFFSLYHVHPYQFVPLAFLGFYLGTAAYFSNSIMVPVIIHFLNNAIAVLMFFFAGNSGGLTSTGDISFQDLTSAVIFFIVGILLLTALIFYIRRLYKQKIS